jgi:hypothetical protein
MMLLPIFVDTASLRGHGRLFSQEGTCQPRSQRSNTYTVHAWLCILVCRTAGLSRTPRRRKESAQRLRLVRLPRSRLRLQALPIPFRNAMALLPHRRFVM